MGLIHKGTKIASNAVTGDTLPVGSIVEYDGAVVPDGYVEVATSKIVAGTRDAGAVSGDIAYTGVGFKPSSIIAMMVVDGTLYRSDGFADSAKDARLIYQSSANVYHNGANLVSYTNYSSWAQNAIVKSYDADGFTITWSKIGTPVAGTMQLMFICYR